MKTIKVNVNSNTFVRAYLTIWNGSWGLTEKEFEVLEVLLKSYLKLKAEGLKEPYLSKFLFSSDSRKEMRTEIGGMSEQSFTNYISALRLKNLVIKNEGKDMIDERAIPVESITFEFKIK